MKEKEFSEKVLDMIWGLEKIAIDFHAKRINRDQFKHSFISLQMQLVILLFEFYVQPLEG